MQAFVITAYKDYEALKTLTLALSQRGLCVIHADAQGAITARQVEELNALPNVRAIRKYKVNWGSVCHLYALLDLCRMALEDERVDYLHLMSAQDVPLLCADEMERRFAGETRLFMRRSTPSPAARGRSCCASSARRISRRNSIFRMCFPARRLSRGSSTGSCIFPSGTSRSAACPPC